MNWFSSGSPTGRELGLLVPEVAAGPAPSPFTFRPNFADMDFAAVYQAAYPGLTAIGGTLDPATAGAAVTLSDGDLTAAFAGVGTVLSTATNVGGTGQGTQCFEVLVTAASNLSGIGCYVQAFGPPYNANASNGNNIGLISVYQATGVIDGFVPGAGAPWGVGDVIGVVAAPAVGAFFDYWLNGVLQDSVGSLTSDNYFAMLTR